MQYWKRHELWYKLKILLKMCWQIQNYTTYTNLDLTAKFPNWDVICASHRLSQFRVTWSKTSFFFLLSPYFGIVRVTSRPMIDRRRGYQQYHQSVIDTWMKSSRQEASEWGRATELLASERLWSENVRLIFISYRHDSFFLQTEVGHTICHFVVVLFE